MKVKFVEGPYLRDGRYVYALVPLLPEDQRKGLMECNTFACCVRNNGGKYAATEEQLEATAALFAAAPELYAELEDSAEQLRDSAEMLRRCGWSEDAETCETRADCADMALAKARGEEA